MNVGRHGWLLRGCAGGGGFSPFTPPPAFGNMKLPATIQLAGKPVKVRRSKRPLKHDWGWYKAGTKEGEIVLSCDLPESEVLRILTHEALHGQFYFLDEDVVDHASKELVEAYEILELI